ncbi:beta-glucosidase [Thermocladium modestius]|uniref:Beta-glucosidase n=1 Tax=Thermocladium modestius TaxID=62609 RepID=A0A830GU95_9CREN|nr:beta-glucosidase [Thermocladium modestius]
MIAGESKVLIMLPAVPHVRIPGDYLIGAAISAYQVEGNNENADWWRYEKAGLLPASGEACRFWEMYRTDLDIMARLGLKALRLSLEWSRVEPRLGWFDDAAMDVYRDMMKEMRQRGITPVVTLHHFTNPIWFHDAGAWERGENLKYFLEYVDYVSKNLDVRYWLTINEVNLYPILAYLLGKFPPFKPDPAKMWTVLSNLLKAHGKAYDKLKRETNMVGIVINVMPVHPMNRLSPLDYIASTLVNKLYNLTPLNALKRGRLPDWLGGEAIGSLDYLGLNYYSRPRVRFSRRALIEFEEGRDNHMGFVVDPRGLGEAIELARRVGRPIMITENGVATDDDGFRIRFIREHLREAVRGGTIGYMYWSLLDNYEWERGYSARFGLIECKGSHRKIRGSAEYLGRVSRSMELD